MKYLLSAMLAIAFAAPAALGVDYFVDAAKGDDANDGISIEAPWKSIEKANAALAPGDTVYIRAGVYSGEWIRPARSGKEDARITYAAYEGEKPEVTGGRYGSVCSLSNVSYITVKGLKFSSPDEHDWTVALTGKDCHHNRIENCEVTDPEGYVCITINEGAAYNEIIGCIVHDTGNANEQSGDGIVMNSGAHHNLVKGNTVYNCCHSQIMALNGSHHNTIVENEMYSTDKAWAGAFTTSASSPTRNARSRWIRRTTTFTTTRFATSARSGLRFSRTSSVHICRTPSAMSSATTRSSTPAVSPFTSTANTAASRPTTGL
ncbi:MAG: right-handed parallel beta-helix repeat-containing protein [Planctomycetota bacterium]